MRLLTRRVYRAFPELDRFSDEQCARFVSAARRGWFRRTFHRSLIALTIVALGLPSLWAAFWLGIRLFPGSDILAGQPPYLSLVWAIICVPLLAPAPIAAFYARDLLLRRRIRYVLRTRGVCASCRYSLVGIPVPDGAMVVCPECGMQTEVDPALGELVRDERGVACFQPKPAAMPRPPRIFTPPRIRFLKRAGLVLLLLVVFGTPALWGLYEVFLRRQAAAAIAARPGPEGLLAFVESHQPPGVTPEDPNAYDFFNAAVAAMDRVDLAGWKVNQPRTSAGTPIYPEYSYIYSPPAPDDRSIDHEEAAAAATLARRLIDDYRAAGVFDELRKLAACRRAVRPVSFSAGQPPGMMASPDLGQSRQFARINVARMYTAAQAGDLTDFTDALESTLALVRIVEQQSLMIDTLVGYAIEGLAFSRLRAFLQTHPDEPWLIAAQAAIDRQRPPVTRSQPFEGERLAALDTLAWVFSDPDHVRWGRYSPTVKSLVGSTPDRSISTFAANKAALDAHYSAAERAVLLEPSARATQSLPPEPELPLVGGIAGPMSKFIDVIDAAESKRRTLTVLIALERFRARTGAYPPSLSALVPDYLASLPLDPWSGRPFGYRLTDQATEPKHRAFLLYSVGADGHDDGGLDPSDNGAERVFGPSRTKPNTDFIINNPDR